MAPRQSRTRLEGDADISIWKEAFFGAELLLLHASPVYYGLGVPHGDGSAVVVIPGFLGSDLYMAHLNHWLSRVGYHPYFSGIRLNAECPNLLIKYRLAEIIAKALRETGRKIHLIGYSLGGMMARSIAAQQPGDVASVITLAAPFRGKVLHRRVMEATAAVREQVIKEHGKQVLPECYTARCTCEFVNSLMCTRATPVMQTAIYTRDDGIVDWRYCRTGDPSSDFEVAGTHLGLVFNPSVYSIVAARLAQAQVPD
jgi:triacylglycerol lipase